MCVTVGTKKNKNDSVFSVQLQQSFCGGKQNDRNVVCLQRISWVIKALVSVIVGYRQLPIHQMISSNKHANDEESRFS